MPVIYLPPPPSPEPPKQWPRVEPHPPKRLVWEPPDESEGLVLSDPDGRYWSLVGRSGFGMPVVEPVVDRVSSGAGLVRDIRTGPRVLSVPLLVRGASPGEYLEAYRALQRAFRHRVRGTIRPGRLRVELPDGTARSIPAYYQGGLDPVEDELDDMTSLHQPHPNLEFLAPEPFWEGPEETVRWRVAYGDAPFYPIYPVELTASSTAGVRTIPTGDATSYPVWRFTGPGVVTVQNPDTGERFGFDQPIPAGVTVTVDCRPVELAPETGLTATDSEGGDWWPKLGDFPSLFSLDADGARVRVQVTDASEDSLVELAYRPRWHTAW